MNPPQLAQIFIGASIMVPVLVVVLVPKGIEWYSGVKVSSRRLLFVACGLFFISWYLPSPYIQGEYTAFTTHFLGGGIFTGLVWLYISEQLHLKFRPLQELCILYFLVSGLGVANELFELLVAQAGWARIDASDTWWDLLANTSGALVLFLSYTVYSVTKKHNRSKAQENASIENSA